MRNVLFLTLAITASLQRGYAQKGRVVDKAGEPVISAVVTQNNTDSTFIKAATTGLDGKFDLGTKTRPYMLLFKHISYLPKKLISSADDLGDIVLEDNPQALSEVVVTPADVTQFKTHTTYRLSEKDIGRHPDFLHALDEIPMLSVGTDNKLSYMGTGSVKVLLNGANSTETELATLNPKDILKVEVYDNPPARFSILGVRSVVNIVTKSSVTGGSVGINLLDAVNPPYGNNSLGASYNNENSRWSFNFDNTLRRNKYVRLSESIDYQFKGQEYGKVKNGLDSPFDWDLNSFQLGYMHRKNDSYQFNLTAGLEIQRWLENNAQDVTYSDGRAFQSQNTIKKNYRKYSLDLYYDKTINKHSDFLVSLTGTYYYNMLFSSYDEKKGASPYFDVFSDISGQKPSLIADIRYAYSAKSGTFSLGIRDYVQQNTQRIQTAASAGTDISSFSNQSYLYGEFSGRIGSSLALSVSLGAEHVYLREKESASFSSIYFRPNVNLNYELKKNMRLFFTYRLTTTPPPISALSETPVWIDNKYAFQGNSALQPFKTHSALLGSYLDFKQFVITVNLSYKISPNEFLPYFKDGDNAVLQTYENMKRAETYDGVAVVSWRPLPSKILLLKLTGYFSRYKVTGDEYNWSQNSLRLFSAIQLNLKKFDISLFYQTASKQISGQLLKQLPAAAYGELYYSPPVKAMKVGLGWRYPFFNSYQVGTETHPSALVHSVSTSSTKDIANLVYLRFTYNFSFGRNTRNNVQKKVNNEDTDSGILTR